MIQFFTPENFNGDDFISDKANQLLNKKSHWVYTSKPLTDMNIEECRWYPEPQIDDQHGINWSTHRALICLIEKL